MDKGQLQEQFQTAVDQDFHRPLLRLSQEVKTQNIKNHNYAVGGKLDDVGRIRTNAHNEENNPLHKNQDSKKTDRRVELLRLIDDLQRDLRQYLNRLQKQLEDSVKLRDELNDQHVAIEGGLEYFRRHGEFDLGLDGYPNDHNFRKVIENWEKKTGQRFDPYSDNALDVLHLIHADVLDRRDQQNIFIQKTTKQISQGSKKLEHIEDLKNDGLINAEDIDTFLLDKTFASQTVTENTLTGTKDATKQDSNLVIKTLGF